MTDDDARRALAKEREELAARLAVIEKQLAITSGVMPPNRTEFAVRPPQETR